MVQDIVIPFIAAATPIFLMWLLYLRKHKASADSSEIENYKLIATEWRETSQRWKDLADDYQMKFIEQNRKMEAFFAQGGDNKRELEENRKEIAKLNGLLTKANKRIKHLEDQLKLKK